MSFQSMASQVEQFVSDKTATENTFLMKKSGSLALKKQVAKGHADMRKLYDTRDEHGYTRKQTIHGRRRGPDRIARLVNVQNSSTFHSNFTVIDVQWSDAETLGVTPTQDNTFFIESSGRSSPRSMRINGALINTEHAEWFKEWMDRYDREFRASKMVKSGSIHMLVLDGVNYYGLIFDSTVAMNAEQDNAPTFGFSFLVMDIKGLTYDSQVNLIDDKYFVDGITQRFFMDGLAEIGYRRKPLEPTDPRLRALGSLAKYAMDPAKWTTLSSLDKAGKQQMAANLVSGGASTYVATAGSLTGNAAVDSGIQTMTSNGFTKTAALAVAKGDLSAADGAKMAETGLQAVENSLKALTAGLRFGVGSEYTPGEAYDNSSFSSMWSDLGFSLAESGFSLARMGISRNLKGGFSSQNFGVGMSSANTPMMKPSKSPLETSSSALQLGVSVDSSEYKGSPTEKMSQALSLGKSGSLPVGPLFDFTPTSSNETGSSPVAMVTVGNASNTGAPSQVGPVYGI